MAGQRVSGSPDLHFFEGFAWAVPTAFAGALAGFRFEQGDVLHRSREAYAGRTKSRDTTALQILAPPRSARAAAEGEGDRRRASFESEVELSIVDLATGARREVETTHNLTALIYEFEKVPDSEAIVLSPGRLTGREHLESAGLMALAAE